MDEILGPGLGESQRALLDLLKRRGEATLAELEKELDLARETVRDHLKALAAQGLVERAGLRRHGPGRPQVVYRLASSGQELFPRREGQLLKELATFLLGRGHGELLQTFFEERVGRKRQELQRRISELDGAERFREVAKILSEEGFLAEVTDDGPDRFRLRLCHCPLREIVAVSHLPCRAEMTLVEELLGESLRRESFMPHGGSSCTYVLQAGSSDGDPDSDSTQPTRDSTQRR